MMTTTHSVHRAVLALGGNLGDRLELLQSALDALTDAPGIQPLSISPVYETAPFGGAPGSPDAKDLSDQPPYLNAVALVGTDLTPHQLLIRTQAIEEALRRVRGERWAPRTIDVDIVVYDDLQLHDEDLTVPHVRAHERGFVLRPWHDIEPEAVLPGRGPIADLLARLPEDGAEPRPDLVLQW
ncbi:MAG TPA: 2-amino-4-hydroxy-6-hydroxymethyldihydropteridine diphosphokinase [Actinospica sp.]|jgi:2-amino-4-hydroxy-6-hydroxymethyldihydropteridine diphosphokinase|nr:2-amino-4-hydroxy-6-hydroxymethyldihydropteridine diphosphokinase [Actinospica sp.]